MNKMIIALAISTMLAAPLAANAGASATTQPTNPRYTAKLVGTSIWNSQGAPSEGDGGKVWVIRDNKLGITSNPITAPNGLTGEQVIKSVGLSNF